MKDKIIVPQLPKYFAETEQSKAVRLAGVLNAVTGKAVYVNEFFDEEGGYEVAYYPSLGIGNVYKKFEAANDRKVKTVYLKSTVYFRAEIEYSDENDLQEKISEFETEVRLDMNNANSGGYDYSFADDGLEEVIEEEIPAWLFEESE